MFQTQGYEGNKQEQYELVIKQLRALIDGEPSWIANLANASALLNQFMDQINWVGFYLMDDKNELALGPFQGLPACTRIPLGRGVCGTSAQNRETLRVADVHEFPGHIACDAASQSEIVIPLIVGSEVIGVLDIDAPIKDRFDEVDQQMLEKFTAVLIETHNK
ncbi:GAF domain-containing protein [Paenibacillus sp. N1-5-1-14]|uniref:GAF domain-containing protein n=1 Tax=Paenibacillus radicibacter TaxID=2972488 RepID=UPI0021593E5A|nr:GAF domain-containing protein [Paenibacillus radicibacter]MCR8645215.1 GAF domain-containing protein [Paenibacillus radicibacter]